MSRSNGGTAYTAYPAEIVDGVVTNKEGRVVDGEFRTGAEAALKKLKESGVEVCILQSRSPSCGVNQIYDGSFSGTLISGSGIFASLAKEKGFRVIDVENLDAMKNGLFQ